MQNKDNRWGTGIVKCDVCGWEHSSVEKECPSCAMAVKKMELDAIQSEKERLLKEKWAYAMRTYQYDEFREVWTYKGNLIANDIAVRYEFDFEAVLSDYCKFSRVMMLSDSHFKEMIAQAQKKMDPRELREKGEALYKALMEKDNATPIN